MDYMTYPYKSGDRGTVFGSPVHSISRKKAAQVRSEICRETSASQRSWTGAVTYWVAGRCQQTQASPVV